jgi:hypothetical protein
MKGYRGEKYLDYLYVHSKELISSLKTKKLALLVFFVLLCLPLMTENLSDGLKMSFCIILLSLMVLRIIPLYVGLSFSYKTYKRSSKQFAAISNKIISSELGLKTTTRQSKSIHTFLGEWEASIQHKVCFDFSNADVFKTKDSLFLFPYRKKAVGTKPYLIFYEYFTPIRFVRDSKEKIHNIYDIYKVTDFDMKLKSNKTVISFLDKNFKKNITINLESELFFTIR